MNGNKMDNTTLLILTLGMLVTFIAWHSPALGGAIAVGVMMCGFLGTLM